MRGRGDGQPGRLWAGAVGGPGGDHIGDPGPGRGGRGDRGGARARGAQVHRVPAARGAGPARAGGAGRGAREVPARGGPGAAGGGRRARTGPHTGKPAGLPGAGPGGGRDRQPGHPVRPRRALPGPGGGPGGTVAAQLGRAAHPAARDLGRQGPAGLPAGRGDPRAPGAAAGALHRAHDHRPARVRPAARAGPGARLRDRGGRTRGRPDRRRGPGPQRRGLGDRLDQRVGPEFPHPGRPHPADSRAGPACGRRDLPPPGLDGAAGLTGPSRRARGGGGPRSRPAQPGWHHPAAAARTCRPWPARSPRPGPRCPCRPA
jgi:hypothetical protein